MVTASDKRLPNLTILKRDKQTGDVIPDTHFEIKGIQHNDDTWNPTSQEVQQARATASKGKKKKHRGGDAR